MKTRLHALALLVVCGILSTSCSTTQSLQGKWNCVSAIIDGKPLPESTASRLTLTLTQGRYTTQKGSEILFDSTYSIDPGKKPGQITMIGTEGDLTGKEARGIYSVEEDTLRICYTMPGNPRPMTFESAPGSGAYLITWKLQKP